MIWGCVSIGVSAAGCVCRVGTARRGHCSFQNTSEAEPAGIAPSAAALPVPEPRRGSGAWVLPVRAGSCTGPGSRCLCCKETGSVRPAQRPHPAVLPQDERGSGLAQEGRGCRAGAGRRSVAAGPGQLLGRAEGSKRSTAPGRPSAPGQRAERCRGPAPSPWLRSRSGHFILDTKRSHTNSTHEQSRRRRAEDPGRAAAGASP